MNAPRGRNVQRLFSRQLSSLPVDRINHRIFIAKLDKYFHNTPQITPRCLMPCSTVYLTIMLIFITNISAA